MEEFETEGQRRLIFFSYLKHFLSIRKEIVKSAVSTNVRNINPSIKTSILRIGEEENKESERED